VEKKFISAFVGPFFSFPINFLYLVNWTQSLKELKSWCDSEGEGLKWILDRRRNFFPAKIHFKRFTSH
jgi:hypothetical protein